MKRVLIPIGEGITGIVAETGKIMNVSNASEHSLFEPQNDQQGDNHTQTILCVPVKDSSGLVIGVLQALNKKGAEMDAFNDFDEELAISISCYASIAIAHAEAYISITSSLEKRHAMMALMDAIYREYDVQFLIQTIVEQIPNCISIQRCELYMVQEDEDLWTLRNDERVGVKETDGLKRVLRDRVRVRLENQSLAVPIQSFRNEVNAVLILHPMDSITMTEDDQELLKSFLCFVSPVIQRVLGKEDDMKRRNRILQISRPGVE